MTIALGVLFALAPLAAGLLILAVLLQEPRTGGLGATLGSAGVEVTGSGSIGRFVGGVAAVWIALCLGHALLQPAGPTLASAAPTPQESLPR